MSENGEAISGLDKKIERLREDVANQFSGIRADIKDLTQSLRELIRIDGDMKRQNDALTRIGSQVDDHEERLRAVEKFGLKSEANNEHSSRFQWLWVSAIASIVSGTVVGISVYAFTH